MGVSKQQQSGWWAHIICTKFGLKDLVNLICLVDFRVNGVTEL